MWYRVFNSNEITLSAAEFSAQVRSDPGTTDCTFTQDEHGWYGCTILSPHCSPILLERYETKKDDLRADLNTWAAYLETQEHSPHHTMLMEKVIQTKELITIRKPVVQSNEIWLGDFCTKLAQWCAALGTGIYQDESSGWFSAQGELLCQEY